MPKKSDQLDSAFELIIRQTKMSMKGLKDEEHIDFREAQDFVDSCNEDLSPNIKKLLKAKNSDKVILANKILKTVEKYLQNLKKIKADKASELAKKGLKSPLENMEENLQLIVKAKGYDEQAEKDLAIQQNRWSKNKVEILRVLKLKVDEAAAGRKRHLESVDGDMKLLLKSANTSTMKMLAAFESAKIEKKKALAKELLPKMKSLASDVQKFQLTETGRLHNRDYASDLLDLVNEIYKELKVAAG